MLLPMLYIFFLLLAAHGQPHKRGTITSSDIQKIDPRTTSCTNAPAAGECRNATQAAPYISGSFMNFGIATFNEQAALLALMLYETGGIKYSKNHYPGVPGQGTRNMQSPAYNLKYATWLSTVCKNCGITTAQVQTAEAAGPANVLELVNTDEWGFGSAAWFLVTQCDGSVREGLAAGTLDGFEGYLSCVGTEANENRTALWKSAVALGQW